MTTKDLFSGPNLKCIIEDTHDTHSKNEDYVTFRLRSNNGNFSPYQFNVLRGPTANCQICSVYHIENLLNITEYINGEEIYKIFEEIHKRFGKRLMIIDIHQNYLPRLNELITKVNEYYNRKINANIQFLSIHTQTDFISTNNSKRLLIMLKRDA